MVWTTGNTTKSTFYQGPESHKLFIEFEVDGTIHAGQPVVLHSSGNKVTAASTSSLETDIIGIAIAGSSAYGAFTTVSMKGYAVVLCKAAEVIVPGPVVYAGYSTDEAYEGNQEKFEGYNMVGKAASGSNVAQVETVTLTGTSGTANVTMGGLTKLATFDTDIETTSTAFVAAHAAAYAAVGITLTGTTTLIFTAAVAGTPFVAGTVENVSGDLAGTVVHTTASEVSGALNRIWGWAMEPAAAIGAIIKVIIKN